MHSIVVKNIAVFIFLFLGSGALAAENESDKSQKDPLSIYREAGVSQAQEAKIRELAKEYEKPAKVRLERLRNLSKEMRDLSFEAELDEKKVLALQAEINELQNSLNNERIKLMLEIRALLSAEQKASLVDIMRKGESRDALSEPLLKP
ncbi:MAG: periplasmic heavy metal sensor [Candidatus Obscuribacterales bacterium]|nr:periplasmic heavy metal sensor [Candidatus Obscuribacterales bacterium]